MTTSFVTINPLDYRPKLIIWDIIDSSKEKISNSTPLSTQECFSIMDSIAEISKPIIVLSGNDPLDRPDIVDIILYGNSIGLKMIVETDGDKLTVDLRNVLRTIGTKSIRILLKDKVKESIEDGFAQTKKFRDLNMLLDELKKDGFEIQLGMSIENFDERCVSFSIDYAIRKNSKGVYFHLKDHTQNKKRKKKKEKVVDKETIIMWIARQKKLLPNEMYFSPQCVRYGLKHLEDEEEQYENAQQSKRPKITHWCLGGKTFAYINSYGDVQVCSGLLEKCGNLRKQNYSFSDIWDNSELFNCLRNYNFTCSKTLEYVNIQFHHEEILKKSVRDGYTHLLEH